MVTVRGNAKALPKEGLAPSHRSNWGSACILASLLTVVNTQLSNHRSHRDALSSPGGVAIATTTASSSRRFRRGSGRAPRRASNHDAVPHHGESRGGVLPVVPVEGARERRGRDSRAWLRRGRSSCRAGAQVQPSKGMIHSIWGRASIPPIRVHKPVTTGSCLERDSPAFRAGCVRRATSRRPRPLRQVVRRQPWGALSAGRSAG